VLIASLSFGIQGILLRRWAAEGADLQAGANDDDRRTIWRIIRQQTPNTIYYCMQGQLMVFLLSIFGSTRHVAEVGALGRLAVFFGLITSVMTGIVQPRFARCQQKARLKRIYGLTMLGFGLISVGLVTIAIVLPGPFLWLLGGQYAHLRRELVYVVLLTVIQAFTGAIYVLNAARAWVRNAWLSIPIILCVQIAMIPWVNLGSIRGVALLSSLPLLPGMLPFLYETYRGFRALPDERSND
jgi:hypothetical protein